MRPPPDKGEQCAYNSLRGTTLLRRYLAIATFLGANTPALYNGSSRRLLLTPSTVGATFHSHSSRGSFSLSPALARITRQLSEAGAQTYFPRSMLPIVLL